MAYTVIVVDDSATMRTMLGEMIDCMPEFRVVAAARDAYDAREKIKMHEPDLVTIDLNMPGMDGAAFLRNLMRLHPMPAIVISSESARSDEVFEDGAVGFVPKPATGESREAFVSRLGDTLLRYTFLLERYQRTKPCPSVTSSQIVAEERHHPDLLLKSSPAPVRGEKLIAIGASTGGVEALTELFSSLPASLPPIVIVQHIPYGFSGGLARRLDACSKVRVVEGSDGMVLRPGSAYLAPGNRHMMVRRGEEGYALRLKDGPKISRHKPSVDLLFRSVNNAAGAGALGILMTGMGDDGVIGLGELYARGAMTIAQDEVSCSVFGMPRQAIERRVVRQVVPLAGVGEAMQEFAKG